MHWDIFISYASEDKPFVCQLVDALMARHLSVWYDDVHLHIGDSLHDAINEGLANSRFGIVILSPSSLAKDWPRKELNALLSKEIDRKKVVLPIWHGITLADVKEKWPLLVDRKAIPSTWTIGRIAQEISKVIEDIYFVPESIADYLSIDYGGLDGCSIENEPYYSHNIRSLLNTIYMKHLVRYVVSYTYGHTWTLESSAGDAITIQDTTDNSPLFNAGINPGDYLYVKLLR